MAEEGAVPVIVTLIEWFLATVVWNNHDAGMDKERIHAGGEFFQSDDKRLDIILI